tara:strand:+ start:1017 stop:1418 length:402 start_codon:yes stop_codon:yes gene_type:complete
MANNITVVGRFTADAEVRKGGKNDFMTFSLADDVAKDKTIFHDCICFEDRLVGAIAQYLTKGKPIFVSGSLEDNSYEKDGVKIRRNQIVVKTINFVGGDKKEEDGAQGKPKQQASAPASNFSGGLDDDDDIPF